MAGSLSNIKQGFMGFSEIPCLNLYFSIFLSCQDSNNVKNLKKKLLNI
jgi:hypothetical protein